MNLFSNHFHEFTSEYRNGSKEGWALIDLIRDLDLALIQVLVLSSNRSSAFLFQNWPLFEYYPFFKLLWYFPCSVVPTNSLMNSSYNNYILIISVCRSGHNTVILGELNKWVPMSPQRVRDISLIGDDIQLHLMGAVGEKVTMTFGDPVSKTWVHISCVIPEDGTTTMSYQKQMCH